MNAAIRWMASNLVAANLLMIALLLGGALFVGKITKETFPVVELGYVSVSVSYPNASPYEVERTVCAPIEAALQGLEGIERSTATATEGFCHVGNEIALGYDSRERLEEIQSRVDALEDLPDQAERPRYRNVKWRNKVISLAIYGAAHESTLKTVTEQIRDELYALPNIRQLSVSGIRPVELSIEVPNRQLQQHQLSLSDLAQTIKNFSINQPSGTLQANDGDILLRTDSTTESPSDFADIPALNDPQGANVRLGDLANIREGPTEAARKSLFNGQPAHFIHIYRVGTQSVLDVAEAVKTFATQKQSALPPGLSVSHWDDRSQMFRSRMELLTRHAFTGLALVFLVLMLFMRSRLAFWVSMGLPVSFLGAMMVLPLLGGSLNMISMFAFILVLGIVVDDAIIVGENIYTRQLQGEAGLPSAIQGAVDVAKPVVFAVLTTIVTFTPVLVLPGVDGQLWRQIPIVVITTLVFSLIESLFILPAHLSNSAYLFAKKPLHWWQSPIRSLQDQFAKLLSFVIRRLYGPLLNLALAWRYTTLALFLASLMLILGLIQGGHLKLVFFPRIDRDSASVALTLPTGTPEAHTLQALNRIESAIQSVNKKLSGDVLRHINTTLGDQPFGSNQQNNDSGSHIGEVAVEFSPAESRDISTAELIQLWRDELGGIPGAVLKFNSAIGGERADIAFQLTHGDLNTLQAATLSFKDALRSYSGVGEVNDSFRRGKRELLLSLRPGSEYLGLTPQLLAQQVREGFYGVEVQTLHRGGDPIEVWLRYPKSERISLANLEQMIVRLPDGRQLPFAAVASAKQIQGPATITVRNQRRIVDVTAKVDPEQGNDTEITAQVIEEVLPQLLAQYPGLSWSAEGRSRNRNEILDSMMRNSLLALLGIYALMAIPFRSYAQPLIVMSAIPFGLVGAILGHLLLKLDISILSLSGMIAVAGVVVNDNLVLVDYINRKRAQGADLLKAVREAGAARFRPILLTSLTTFAGLTPLMLEKSNQAQFLIPMGVSLSFGVLFATVVSLILVPATYYIIEDIRALGQRLA